MRHSGAEPTSCNKQQNKKPRPKNRPQITTSLQTNKKLGLLNHPSTPPPSLLPWPSSPLAHLVAGKNTFYVRLFFAWQKLLSFLLSVTSEDFLVLDIVVSRLRSNGPPSVLSMPSLALRSPSPLPLWYEHLDLCLKVSGGRRNLGDLIQMELPGNWPYFLGASHS